MEDFNESRQRDEAWMLLSAAAIRARARAALKGKWGRALLVCAADTLIMACYGYLSGRLLNRLLLPVLYGEAGLVISLPLPMTAALILTGYVLILPLYTIGLARTAHRIAMGAQADFSLLQVSLRDLFKGVQVGLVCGWRVLALPLACAWALALLSAFLGCEPKFPDVLNELLLYGSMGGALIAIVCRLMHYLPVYQLMAVYPEMSAQEAVCRCRDMMKGYRGRLFGLLASLLGWALLYGVFWVTVEEMVPALSPVQDVLGVLGSFVSLPLTVYVQTALAVFTMERTART